VVPLVPLPPSFQTVLLVKRKQANQISAGSYGSDEQKPADVQKFLSRVWPELSFVHPLWAADYETKGNRAPERGDGDNGFEETLEKGYYRLWTEGGIVWLVNWATTGTCWSSIT
jgi:hypothetical protein